MLLRFHEQGRLSLGAIYLIYPFDPNRLYYAIRFITEAVFSTYAEGRLKNADCVLSHAGYGSDSGLVIARPKYLRQCATLDFSQTSNKHKA